MSNEMVAVLTPLMPEKLAKAKVGLPADRTGGCFVGPACPEHGHSLAGVPSYGVRPVALGLLAVTASLAGRLGIGRAAKGAS
jgi:hypothetical protein